MAKYIKEIEAEAAIKCLFPDMPRIEFNGNRSRWREENEPYMRCLDVLRSLPTVDVPDRKVGKWGETMTDELFTYKGWFFEQVEGYTVAIDSDGDRFWFASLEEAKAFIDRVEDI